MVETGSTCRWTRMSTGLHHGSRSKVRFQLLFVSALREPRILRPQRYKSRRHVTRDGSALYLQKSFCTMSALPCGSAEGARRGARNGAPWRLTVAQRRRTTTKRVHSTYTRTAVRRFAGFYAFHVFYASFGWGRFVSSSTANSSTQSQETGQDSRFQPSSMQDFIPGHQICTMSKRHAAPPGSAARLAAGFFSSR
jgi:hypothetical protein